MTVASTLAFRALPAASAYSASKHGIVGLTRALPLELGGEVGVTMLAPGGMDTGFFDGRPEEFRPAPDQMLNDPADVAETVLFALAQPPGCGDPRARRDPLGRALVAVGARPLLLSDRALGPADLLTAPPVMMFIARCTASQPCSSMMRSNLSVPSHFQSRSRSAVGLLWGSGAVTGPPPAPR